MKKLLLFLCLYFQTMVLYAGIFSEQEHIMQEDEPSFSRVGEDESTGDQEETPELLVSFSYNHVNLTTIINQLAEYRGYNVILPQAPNAINATVTFALEEPVSIEKAWQTLVTILDVVGYTIVYRGNAISIVKNNKDIGRETFHTYIGTESESLPESSETIKYVYYLKNVKISDKAGESDLITLFKTMMPAEAIFLSDPVTNALILVGKSKDIKGFIHIVLELDQIKYRESMEIITLKHASVTNAAQLINEYIIKQSANQYRLDTKRPPESAYINPFSKVIPEPRLNRLILLGDTQSIERLSEFIVNTIDVDLSKQDKRANSVLHIYELQYRDSESLAEVLKRIVESSRAGGEQQQSRGKTAGGGPERSFDEVIIVADKPKRAEELQYYGGNKLIVACSNEDWEQLRNLIEQLDTPDSQIFIEVLIADLTLDDTRALSAQFRTPAKLHLPGSAQFQSGNFDATGSSTPPTIIAQFNDATPAQPNSIQGDLLTDLGKQAEGLAGQTLANFAQPGSTLVSISDADGKTWGLLDILSSFNHAKVLSHPHIICTNNRKAINVNGEQLLLRDETTGGVGAPVTRNKPINAELRVEVIARITGDLIYLQLKISINQFLDNQGTQAIRQVETNVIVPNEGIFVCGGLTQLTNTESVTKVPILGDIPIIGPVFFSKKRTEVIENNLTVFISPTIIRSQFHSEPNAYTQDYINIAKTNSSTSQLFETLKDPITRWFFPIHSETIAGVDYFVDTAEKIREQKAVAPAVVVDINAEIPAKEGAQDAPAKPKDVHPNKEISEEKTAEQLAALGQKLKNEENPFLNLATPVEEETTVI